jgi:hypothetical protein
MTNALICDYFRTSAVFQVPDIYRFAGEITGFERKFFE